MWYLEKLLNLTIWVKILKKLPLVPIATKLEKAGTNFFDGKMLRNRFGKIGN